MSSTRAPSRLEAWPVLTLALAFGWLSGWWMQAGMALALAGVAAVRPPRIAADRLAQLALILTGLVGAVLLAPDADAPPLGRLQNSWALVANAGLFVAAPRLWLARALGGARATAAVNTATLMALGGYRAGPLWVDAAAMAYAAYAALFGWLQLDVLARLDATWVPGQRSSARLGIILLTMAFAAPFSVILPAGHAYLLDRLGFGPKGRVGFGPSVRLGSLEGLLQSSEPVLRLSGPKQDHLRGAVYTQYVAGRWVGEVGPMRQAQASGVGGAVLIESLGKMDHRYFLPLEARAVSVPGRPIIFDEQGVLQPIQRGAPALRFDPGPRDAFEVAPPGPHDRHIPERLVGPLRRLVSQWTGSAGTASGAALAARINRIAEHLRTHYTYSLNFQRRGNRDPLLEFLLDQKTGHCEYFASAMTLLARAAGAPARLVTGFRVTEQNPLTHSWIVRERNAHAWSEVWLDGSWRTVDATAPSALLWPSETPTWAALVDALATWSGVAWRWVKARTAAQLAVLMGALLLFWLGLRFRRRRRVAFSRLDSGAYRDPSPHATALLRALAARGVRYAMSEPLESLVSRIRGARGSSAELVAAADALTAYAALRYGGLGDPKGVAEVLDHARRGLR